MYCVHCGAKNSDTAKFCRSCGKPLVLQQTAEVDENTLVLGEASEEGMERYEEPSQGEPPYDGEPFDANQSQPYGSQPYGTGGYGSQQPYGSGGYGNQQPSYGTGGYGNQPPYGSGGYGPYGTGQYENQPPYGTGGYENQQSYGTGQPYGAGPSGYGQNPYGYPPAYNGAGGTGKKKKGKKGIVAAVIVLLLAALLGGGAFLFIKGNDPMTPVNQLFAAVKSEDWEKAYDSIYWGDERSPNWISREDFIQEAKSSMSGVSAMAGVLDTLKFEKASEGAPYEGEDGLTRKKITVKMSVEFMGMSESEEADIIVVKSGKKFLLIPVWQIDNEGMEELF